MWSRRSIEALRHGAHGLFAAALLTLGGCATPGPGPASRAESDGEVPPQARTLYEQAAAVMAAGDHVDAALRFEAFVLEYPDYPGAWINLAILHGQNGDNEAAGQAIDRALELNPEHAAALNQKGVLLRGSGRFHEAEAAYLKAVTARPDYALAHYNLGVLNELYLGRLDVALQHFEKYQSLVGEDEQVRKWITDLRRRVAANERTASVAE